MCLDRVEKVFENPSEEVREVWKVFRLYPDGGMGPMYYPYWDEEKHRNMKTLPRGEWLQANDWNYPWHFLEDEEEARLWAFGRGVYKILKVRVRGVRQLGGVYIYTQAHQEQWMNAGTALFLFIPTAQEEVQDAEVASPTV